jgi:alkylhydroperoxidase family enzyme
VLRPIDEVLLHSPRVADGWNSLLGSVRGGLDLRDDLLEIVALRVAVLNDAPYEWSSHEPPALRAGLTPAQLAVLRRPDAADSPDLDDDQCAVVRFTDALTRDLVVVDPLFADLHDRLGTSGVVELTVAVGAYNMVSRVVVALGVEVPSAASTEATAAAGVAP